MYVSKVTRAGQISLPKALREELGLEEEYVVIEPFGDALLLRKVKSIGEELFKYFEEGANTKGLSRDDVERAIRQWKKKTLKRLLDA